MPLAAVRRSVYEFALKHLETEKARINGLIESINGHLGTSIPTITPSDAPVAKVKKTRKKKRVFSAEGKARMVQAQKERWASFHAKQKETTDMLAKLERNSKKTTKKQAAAKGSKSATKKAPAVKKAAKKATKKLDNSDIPF